MYDHQRRLGASRSWVLHVQSQYNAPTADYGGDGIPANRVQAACELLSDSSLHGTDLLAAMVNAMSVFTGNASFASGCLDINGASPEPEPEPYGPAEAPASSVAELVPESAPSAFGKTCGKQFGLSSTYDDPVYYYSSGTKFAYQVMHDMPCR